MDHRRIASVLTLALAATIATPAPPARAQSAGLVSRMSVDSAGTEGDGTSGSSAVSADGRFVAFESAATNLVPSDTNDNSDVFVHDTMTGVVQRVSLTWNGMEARDDSWCPAISADGRYVAFLSRAWNMYPGGANLGHPRWDVYLRDRQAGTTLHVTRAPDGSDPDSDSGCPSISADGSRIAFSSFASNLGPAGDGPREDVYLFDTDKQKTKLISRRADGRPANGNSRKPSISADGKYVAFVSNARDLDGASLPGFARARVFLRDLTTGTTDIVDMVGNDPLVQPNGESYGPVAVSGDGRLVAFESYATNLDPSAPLASPVFSNIYLRDRVAGRTTLVSREDPLLTDCQLSGPTLNCDPSSSYLGAISADGRYVTFTSYSQRILPMSFTHAPQVYVYDVLSGRQRRVSVDPDGWETACNGAPALSGDGSVLALASDGGILPQSNSSRDVYRHQWQCSINRRCRPAVACPATPMSCASATGATFRLRRHPPGGIDEDRLFYRWSGAADPAPLPDPTGDARYQLCVYAGAQQVVAMDVGTPDADACPARGPCWQVRPGVHKLLDVQGGLTGLTLNNGASKGRILARGKGPLLDAPFLPFTSSNGIKVQLQDRVSGRCWGADFPASSIKKNFAGQPGYRSRRDGWLVAELR